MVLRELDSKVQEYIRGLRSAGTPVNTAIVMASAKGLILASNRSLLVEYGGHVCLTTAWAKSLMKRMGLVYRKASTTRSKLSSEEFQAAKDSFLKQVSGIMKVSLLPPSLSFSLSHYQ